MTALRRPKRDFQFFDTDNVMHSARAATALMHIHLVGISANTKLEMCPRNRGENLGYNEALKNIGQDFFKGFLG